MSGTIEYIESYFQQTLSSEEKTAFEARCETDEAFAKEVAFYITTRQALREELLTQKVNEWKNETIEQEEIAPVISIAKRKSTSFGKWLVYAAAACFLLAVSVYLFEARTTPQKLAANYLSDLELSQKMDASPMDESPDNLELGIANYVKKDYEKALQLFKVEEQKDPLNSYAKKYAGLVYLQQKNYDKAIEKFDDLSKMNLKSNAGDFLKAVALLKRNNPGDEATAKALLQKVVNEKEEGSEEAEEWLKKF